MANTQNVVGEAIYNRFCGNMVFYSYEGVSRLIAPQYSNNTNYSTLKIPTFNMNFRSQVQKKAKQKVKAQLAT